MMTCPIVSLRIKTGLAASNTSHAYNGWFAKDSMGPEKSIRDTAI